MISSAQREIVESQWWSTANLVSWALNWAKYSGHGYLWELISSTKEEAREFYSQLQAEEDDSYVRWCAAEILADGGWTLQAINYRKS